MRLDPYCAALMSDLQSKMEGNDKLDALLADVLSNTEKAIALAKEAGVEVPAAGGASK